MTEKIRALIDAIEAGKSVDIQDNFEAAIADKLSSAIDARKEEIATSLFNARSEDNEDDSHGL